MGAPPPYLSIAVDGAVRGALAMLAGFAATAAIALVLWTITPTATDGPEPQFRGTAAAYVLAHFGDVTIGTATLTLTPLLLTALFATVLAFGPGRGRPVGDTAAGEVVSIASGAIAYAVLVTAAALTVAPAGAHDPWVALWSLLMAAAALTVGRFLHSEVLRELITSMLPTWVPAAVRAGGGAVATLLAGAALVVAGALIGSFSTAAELTGTVANSVGDGISLTVVGLGYLPNLVLAATGYVTGTGFTVGAGTYSPFGSVLADLPPFPALAGVPRSAGTSTLALVLLVIPLAAGFAAALLIVRRLSERRDRVLGVVTAAVVAGVASGLLVLLARGGVVGGPWPTIGADGWRVGLIVAAAVLVVAGPWVLAAGYRHDAVDAIRSARERVFDRRREPEDSDRSALIIDGDEIAIDSADVAEVAPPAEAGEDAVVSSEGVVDRVPGFGDSDSDSDHNGSDDDPDAVDADEFDTDGPGDEVHGQVADAHHSSVEHVHREEVVVGGAVSGDESAPAATATTDPGDTATEDDTVTDGDAATDAAAATDADTATGGDTATGAATATAGIDADADTATGAATATAGIDADADAAVAASDTDADAASEADDDHADTVTPAAGADAAIAQPAQEAESPSSERRPVGD